MTIHRVITAGLAAIIATFMAVVAAPQASAEAGTCESTWGSLWDGTQAGGYCGLGTSQVTVQDGRAPISGSYGSWQAASADGAWTAIRRH